MTIRYHAFLVLCYCRLAMAGGPLASGADHLLFLRGDGSLWTAGSDAYGQLGGTDGAPHPIPFQAVEGRWIRVSAGDGYSMALRDDGTLWAFGRNDAAQLGKLTRRIVRRPQRAGGHRWIDVAAGETATLAIRSDSSLRIWGGWAKTAPRPPLSGLQGKSRLAATADARWRTVAIGARHGLAIRDDGTLWAIGSGALGCPGVESARLACRVSDGRWTAIAAGDGFSAAIAEDGSLWTWGANDHGQLGRSEAGDALGRVGTGRWLAVAAGARHVVALRADSSLWTWGYGGDGALGDGAREDRDEPVPVDHGKWASIAAGRGHTLARRADGKLLAWGDLGFATPVADPERALALRPVLLERGLAVESMPSAVYGDKPVAIAAEAFRGDDLVLECANAAVGVVEGLSVAIRGAGSTMVRARAVPRPGWGVADTQLAEAALTVAKAPQSIDFAALADVGAGAAGFSLRATSSAGLPVSFRSADQKVARVAGSRLKPAAAGETEVMALQPGDANHLPAVTVIRKLRVLPVAAVAPASEPWTKTHEAWLWAGGGALAAGGAVWVYLSLIRDPGGAPPDLGVPPGDPVLGGAQ
jgi:hypothetical protein